MNDLETVKTIRSQALEILRRLTENPKPSYTIDGQQVSWSEYLNRMTAVVDWCDRRLAEADPVQIVSRGIT
ncbi:hypothetical protein JCM19992_02730 [Thermostilla marina]